MKTIKQLVTIDERRWIKANAIKMFGSAIQFPVLDVDKAVEKIREQRANNNLSPYIEIQPISVDMHKTPNKMATFQKDPMTGVLYGIALSQDDFGNIRWQKIQLHDSISLNLDNTNDAKIWSVLRFYPELEGSPFQVDTPYYKVFDPTDQAIAEMGIIADMRKAFNRVEMIQDKPREMVLFARYLGEELMENSNENIVVGSLLRHAKDNPAEFNRKWDSKNRSYGERFYSGVAVGVITQDADRGFMFRHISLGANEEESISFLSKDSNIMSSLNSDLAEKDILARTISSKKEEMKELIRKKNNLDTLKSGNESPADEDKDDPNKGQGDPEETEIITGPGKDNKDSFE